MSIRFRCERCWKPLSGRMVVILIGLVFMLVLPVQGQNQSDKTAQPAGTSGQGAVAQSGQTARAFGQAGTNPALAPGKSTFEPYLAVVTADKLYVRSGPADIYYPVGRLNKGQQVIVREEKFGQANWAKIDPTPQCFSYIAKKFVTLQGPVNLDESGKPAEKAPLMNPPSAAETQTPAAGPKLPAGAKSPAGTDSNNPATGNKLLAVNPKSLHPGLKVMKGIVTGDIIRVRAGSIKVPPRYASQVQTKLNKGDVVYVIGERDDYYKIIPPKGCYFWVSMDYIKKTGPVTAAVVKTMRKEAGKAVTGKALPVSLEKMDKERKEYFAIADLFKAEQKKPIKQRNYSVIKQRLDKLMQTAQSPAVKKACLALGGNLNRVIIAQEVLQRSLAQDEQLRITLEKINKTIETLAAERNLPGKKPEDIIVKGRIEHSAVFTAPNKNRRYLVLDDNDKILYYAIAGRSNLDLEKWVGKKVTLSGKLEFDTFGKTRIVKVSDLVVSAESKNRK